MTHDVKNQSVELGRRLVWHASCCLWAEDGSEKLIALHDVLENRGDAMLGCGDRRVMAAE